MNFPKLMVLVAVVVVAIGSIMYFTRTNRSDPAAVARAFTKAMKKQDSKAASGFYMPDKADAWLTATQTKIDGMKSGTFTRYYEGIPEDPVFTTPAGASGTIKMQTAAKDFDLELTQVDSKWYVSKTAL